METCINDALDGYCSTIGGDDTGVYLITDAGSDGRNKRWFDVMFLDTSGCSTSQCGNHEDDDSDGERDFCGTHGFPAGTDCTDYDDDDEFPDS